MKKLSIEQHKEVALLIYGVRDGMLRLITELAPAGKAPQTKASKVLSKLDSLRSRLDNELCAIPGFDIKQHDFYYGNR